MIELDIRIRALRVAKLLEGFGTIDKLIEFRWIEARFKCRVFIDMYNWNAVISQRKAWNESEKPRINLAKTSPEPIRASFYPGSRRPNPQEHHQIQD